MIKSRFIKVVGAITIINMVARLLGFVREVSIGYIYGTTYQADSIITAFTIPNFIHIVIGGAATTAFISVYSKLRHSTKNDFVQTVLTLLSIVIGALTILFMIFPEFWIGLFFSGMSGEALELTSRLFMWTAPATFFLVLSIVLSGLHNVHENYTLSTMAGFMFNLVFLVAGVGLTPWLMEYSYALGATAGSLIMVLILALFVKKQQIMPLRFKLVKLTEITRFLKLALPLMLGGATLQFYQIIQRVFAANLDSGVISALNYASKMTQFPQAVLMTSVTTIVYPLLAKAAGDSDFDKLDSAYKKGFRLLTLLLLPVSIFIFFYAKDIISFVFEYGNFEQNSTNITYPLLQVFSLAVISLALNMYITRFFYALENTVLPIVLNIITVFGINILVIELFIDTLGATAIALGTVISTIVNTLLLIFFAKVRLDLMVCNWDFIVKLIPYVVITFALLGLSAAISADYTMLSLAIGGFITAGIILGGLKVIK